MCCQQVPVELTEGEAVESVPPASAPFVQTPSQRQTRLSSINSNRGQTAFSAVGGKRPKRHIRSAAARRQASLRAAGSASPHYTLDSGDLEVLAAAAVATADGTPAESSACMVKSGLMNSSDVAADYVEWFSGRCCSFAGDQVS